ncbi:hypothetical protein [Planobispora takensis]|uniref:hypothetical protein n=1 Tax=Planobispora takensis TaxID=1367882 RepID=UPI001943273C|nr:hypothetical protein [Planobispora takensis]
MRLRRALGRPGVWVAVCAVTIVALVMFPAAALWPLVAAAAPAAMFAAVVTAYEQAAAFRARYPEYGGGTGDREGTARPGHPERADGDTPGAGES